MYSFLKGVTPKGVFDSKEFTQALLVFSTVCLSASLWKRRKANAKRLVKLIDAFPGPRKFSILGNILEIYIYKLAFNPAKDLMPFLQKLLKEKGSVFRFWMLDSPSIAVADAELAIKLLNEGSINAKGSIATKISKAIGGVGLITLPVDIHSTRRKQWMPSFSRKQVEMSIKFFREQAIRLCDELEEFGGNGNVFDMVGLSVGSTFRAICTSAFGEEYMTKLPDSVGKDHMHDLHTVSLNMAARYFKPWFYNDLVYFHGTAEGRETMKCVKRAHTLTKNALLSRQRISRCDFSGKSFSAKKHACFLDHMMELMNAGQLTEYEVIQELNSFIVGGYDTTGVTLCYVLYFLSLYPEHQEKIVEELCGLIPPDNWNCIKDYSITASDTKQMKYLELCVKETLRLLPIAPILVRSTTHDVKLPDGRIIPEGVDVSVLLYVILRDPKYFPEPDKFIPERHLKPSPAFMPFGLGTRNCIGQVYAMFEMKVILAYLLMSYKWETTEKEDFKPAFQGLQVPGNGMGFKIRSRTFSN